MKSSDIPHEYIRRAEDCSWSLRLLDMIVHGSPDDYDDVINTLQCLDDFRTIEPLIQLTEDTSREPWRRDVASRVLCSCNTWEARERRRRWWHSGDAILMRQAVCLADKSDADLFADVASDPEHACYIDAIESMTIGFDEPRFMNLRLDALFHPDAEVRAVAADSQSYDEPVRATDRLLYIAKHDENEPAQSALATLAYYAQRRVLLELSDLRSTSRGERRESVEFCLNDVLSFFNASVRDLQSTNAQAFELLGQWLEPVAHLLELHDHDEHRDSPSTPSEGVAAVPISVNEVKEYFDSLDAPKVDRWKITQRINQSHWTETEQLEATRYFRNHVDWSVRDVACVVIGKWKSGQPVLFEFLQDDLFSVRKSAAYFIRECSRDPAIARKLLEMLTEHFIVGVHAYEVLESYAAHAGNGPEVNGALESLARDDERETVQHRAVHLLSEREQRDAISRLLFVLPNAPQANWSVHCALLSSCTKLDIDAPGVRGLSDVDDLFVQMALAEYLAR